MGEQEVNDRSYYALLLLIVVLAFGLRLAGIGVKSLSNDETISVFDARGLSYHWVPRDLGSPIDRYGDDYSRLHSGAPVSLGSVLHAIRHNEEHPPLFFLLLALWSRAFGVSQSTLRCLPALFGVLSVLLTAMTASYLGNRRLGLASAALVGALPVSLYFSQELRPYSLLMCVALAALYAFARLSNERKLRWALLLTAIYAVGFYTHYIFALLVAVQLACALASKHRFALLRFVVPAAVIAGLLFLPWLPVMKSQLSHTASVTSETPVAGGAKEMIKTAVFMLGNYWAGLHHRLLKSLCVPAAIAMWGLLISWLFAARGKGENARILTWHAVVPFAVPAVFFLMRGRIQLWQLTKHYVYLLPMASIAVAWALFSLRRRVRIVLWIIIIIGIAVSDATFPLKLGRLDMQTAAGIARAGTADAGIVVTEGSPSQIGYYVGGLPNRTSTCEFTPAVGQRYSEICLLARTDDMSATQSVPDLATARKWMTDHMERIGTRRCSGYTIESYRRR